MEGRLGKYCIKNKSHTWFEAAPTKVLARSEELLGRMRKPVVLDNMEDELAKGACRPWTRAVAKRVKKGYQRRVRQHIEENTRRDPHSRIRHKLERWHFEEPPRWLADRCQRTIQRIGATTPPRARAAVLSTAWNRWFTEARFQRRGGVKTSANLDVHLERRTAWNTMADADVSVGLWAPP